MERDIKAATACLKEKFPRPCEVGIILGSGLGALAETVEKAVVVPYGDIPHFPESSVPGHAGRFLLGEMSGRAVAVMQGRIHYYEGFSGEQLSFPVRVMRELGVSTLILSNAAGGVNADFSPGDLMLVSDHINFMGMNPLRGRTATDFGPRFPDMSEVYSSRLRQLTRKVAAGIGIDLKEGKYLAVSGPSYETPAEIAMFRLWGADAVGMSTVPEAIAASQAGLKVLCVSCITNMAAGLQNARLNHEEVLEVSRRVGRQFVELIRRVVGEV